jgi:hypothetical protein
MERRLIPGIFCHKKYGVEVKLKDLANLKDDRNLNYFYLGGYETKDNGNYDYMEFNKRRICY